MKVFEFDFLKHCAWTSDFQCSHPISESWLSSCYYCYLL